MARVIKFPQRAVLVIVTVAITIMIRFLSVSSGHQHRGNLFVSSNGAIKQAAFTIPTKGGTMPILVRVANFYPFIAWRRGELNSIAFGILPKTGIQAQCCSDSCNCNCDCDSYCDCNSCDCNSSDCDITCDSFE